MNRRIATLTLALATLLVAGCELEDPNALAAKPAYPPEVIAALPPGVPPSIIFKTADNCYAYAIEVSEPQTGFRLRDRNGQVICDAGATPQNTTEASAG